MDPIRDLLSDVLDEIRPHDGGEMAGYIPQLAAADPEKLAFAVVGPRGRVRTVGDDDHLFSIQSISKPFVFALALEALGRDAVMERVGCEPSGEPFHAISLEDGTGRPANPMINAGAIATTSLIAGEDTEERTATIVAGLSAFAGRSLWVDEDVYASESETGDRNRALGHLLRSYGVIEGSVEHVVEAYFRQCALLVGVRDLAVMSATLAFGGVNPVTGIRVVGAQVARDVVSVMASCGMYDSSGDWLLRVGLPAKSGVSGGLVAVAPSQFGVAAFSPRLDAHGSSVRGRKVVETLSERFGMHLFETQPSLSEPAVVLAEGADGPSIRLGGELGVAGAEHLAAALHDALETHPEGTDLLVDARQLARTHRLALAALEAEFDGLPVRFRAAD